MKNLLNPVIVNIVLLRNLLMGGFLNAAGIGFAVYIGVIFLPGVRGTPAMLESLRAGETTMVDVGGAGLFVAVPALLIGLLIFARHGALTVITHFQAALVFLWVFSCLVLLFTVLLGDYPDSISQVTQYMVTLGGFVLCICFWQASEHDVDNALTMAFVALSGGLIICALVQGFHDYRWVGLIHPNHYGRYAYVALVLHSILIRRVSLPVFLFALAATYMVSARTIMIGLVLFCAGYMCCTFRGIPANRTERDKLLRLLAAALIGLPIGLGMMMLVFDGGRLVSRLSEQLAILDPDRGIFSGFTGRSDSWNAFFDSMDKFAFFGYGFRSSRYNMHSVHSGILSYFMDFGLLLGSLLLFAVLIRTTYLIWFGIKFPDRRSLICGLALASTLVIQCLEPDNFNIGFIGAFFFMMILAYAKRPLSGTAMRPLVWRATDPANDNANLMRRYRGLEWLPPSASGSTRMS